MKKLFSILLAAMMFALCLPAGALADSAPGLRTEDTHVFTIGTATGVQPDSDVVIPVDLSGPDYEAHSVRLEVYFDETMLTVSSYSYGEVTNGKPSGSMAFCNIAKPGFISFAIICPNAPFSGTGNMINFTFHTAADFDGIAELDLQVKEFYYYPAGGSQHNFPHTDVDGYITNTVVRTVDFVDWDGTVLKHELVPDGGDATPPSNPSRVGYTFAGWDGDYTNVTEDRVITALYNINYYTVKFVDTFDGDPVIIDEQTVEFQGSATAPEPPVHKGYTFTGWSRDFSCVTTNLIVYAMYEITTYTVTFLDMDGTVLSVQQVLPGESATPPTPPVHEGYTFTGWDTYAFNNVTSDLTVTAQYTPITFRVTFYDMDGTTEIIHQNVPYGQAATAPTPPVHTGLTFVGWDTDFSAVYSDLDVVALYETTLCTVTFVDMDGVTVISEQTVAYGGDAVEPEAPVHEGYTFIGWDQPFTNVTSDLTVTAQYEIMTFTVTFYDMDGETVIAEVTVEYGSAAEAPEPPVHEGFVFVGWDKDFSCVTEDMDVTAVYAEEGTTCTVTFVDPFGEVIDVQIVPYGEAAVAPEPPEIPLQVFIGWDKDFSCVTEDMTVTAQYALLGDVNFDGVINTEDALHTLRAALNLETFTDDQMLVGDINGDGVINTEDALHILRMALGLE